MTQQQFARTFCFLTVIIGLGCLYAALATGGTMQFVATRGDYDALAEGFRAGHLYVPDQPNPALLTLADPYDPAQNAALRFHDASLYKGRYYLYWGPFPALPHLLSIIATGEPLLKEIPMAVSGALGVGAFWRLLLDIRCAHKLIVPTWLILTATLGLALGGLFPYLIGQPSIYLEPLLVASALALWSFACLNRAFVKPDKRSLYLLASGTLLGAAVASRITYVGYCLGAVTGLFLLALLDGHERWRPRLKDLLTLGAPILATGVVLALYNFARFDSFLEFGTRYQLHGSEELYRASHLPNGGGLSSFLTFSPADLPTKLAVYLVSWPEISLGWPYFSSSPIGFIFPKLDAPPSLVTEMPVLSVAALYPLGFVGILAPLTLVRWRKRGERWLALVLALWLGAFTTLVLIASAPGMAIRYVVDIAPVLYLLGCAMLLSFVDRLSRSHGANLVEPRFRRFVHRATEWCAVASCVVSLGMGLLLAATSFRYSMPATSASIATTSNELVERLIPRVAPWALASALDLNGPVRPETWSTPDGHYTNGAPITLRSPGDQPSLAVLYDTDAALPGPLELSINDILTPTSSTPPPGLRLQNRQRTLSVTGVAGIREGALVQIRLTVGALAEQRTPLPVIVRAIMLSRSLGQ